MPLSPGGVIPRDMNARQWDQFVARSGIQADATVKTFTPTWTGFSVDPTGDMSYMDFGAIVIMWSDDGFFGTSDAVTFGMGNIPEAIVPSGTRYISVVVVDQAFVQSAGAMVSQIDGTWSFALGTVAVGGGPLDYDVANWSVGTTKGLPPGFLVVYSK